MGEAAELAGISLISLLQGFGLGAGLIIAIGAQNAFVLRQGLKRQHLFVTAGISTLCDGWAAKARWVEDLGYSTFLVADHPWLDVASIPALMMVADSTSLRIGSHVFNINIRHPALLAKDMAMLDVLSRWLSHFVQDGMGISSHSL
jgi:Luciferase-like monooxygenase